VQAQELDAAPDTQATSRLVLGVGIGGLRLPDYPGAAEHRDLLLPFPYVVYHSRYLDVNHDQVRGKLFSSERFALDVDFGGAVSVDSSRDPERQGMPNLDWMGEVGPALRYKAWRDADETTQLNVIAPLRAAASASGLRLHHRGWVFEPRAVLVHHIGDDINGYSLEAGASLLYSDRDYNNYYYGVAPQYAAPQRPAYTAPGGYGGYRLALGWSLHRGDMVYGAFLNYMDLDGASFAASPLVSRRHDISIGFAVSWVLKRMD
jgi:outer membrane scaffolding protein for murein synthesis (MipA/OmpV family)